MYTAHDINFTIVGYAWIAIWYCFAVFEMVYVKKVVDTVQMTTWSRTYYQARAPVWTAPFPPVWTAPFPNIELWAIRHACR